MIITMWLLAHLAQGLIFRARPRLMQNPAPPVANQNFTDTWNEEDGKSAECYQVKREKHKTSRLKTPAGSNLLTLNSFIRDAVRGAGNRVRFKQTDRSVALHPLCSLYGMVQTGPAQVDVLAVMVWGQQSQQTGQDHIVIIIHMAEPPTTHRTSAAHIGQKSHHHHQ